MSSWAHSAAFRIAIAAVMTLGMLLSAMGGAISHNPAALAANQAARHAELAVQLADHGHVHDDGMDDEQSPGHLHGHNPADHSHETPNTLADLKAPAPPIGRAWHPHPPVFVDPDATFPFERPPRPTFAA